MKQIIWTVVIAFCWGSTMLAQKSIDHSFATPVHIESYGTLTVQSAGNYIATCGTSPNGRLVNCKIAEGHDLTEVLQVIQDSGLQSTKEMQEDNADLRKRLQAVIKVCQSFLKSEPEKRK